MSFVCSKWLSKCGPFYTIDIGYTEPVWYSCQNAEGNISLTVLKITKWAKYVIYTLWNYDSSKSEHLTRSGVWVLARAQHGVQKRLAYLEINKN